jgi:hypothetical protein
MRTSRRRSATCTSARRPRKTRSGCSTGDNLASHSRKNVETFWTRLQRGSEWLRSAFALKRYEETTSA